MLSEPLTLSLTVEVLVDSLSVASALDELALEFVALELEDELDEALEFEAVLELEEEELVLEEGAVEVDPVLVEVGPVEDVLAAEEELPPVDVADESEVVPVDMAGSSVSLEAQAPKRLALTKPRVRVARAR